MARPSQSEVVAGPTPPRTPYEEVVHGIWKDVLVDVLGVAEFGVHDDFFELGGHSLAAPRIVARIRKTLGVHVPVREFFGCRTVAALASVVAAQASAGPQVIGRRPPEAQSVLSYDQQRIWLENQLLPSLAYNVHGRQRLIGPLDVPALQASVRAILLRHEALRTRFPVTDGRPVQVVDDLPADWRLDVRDLTDLDPDERLARAGELADEQVGTPFDLAAGPLFRCRLIRLGDTEHVLSLTAHHIVCDDWSVGVFMRELSALYAAGGDPDRAGLPPLPIQYRDYAAWQRDHLTGDTLERTVGYWREHLAGAPPALTLPVAHHRGGNRQRGDWLRAALTEDETAALHQLCRTHGMSPFMVMMAVLATVLARWSGQRDLVIGVPIAGRTDAGTETLIGFLLNTLPIRVDLSGDPTFADLLGRVRQVCLDGYAHSDAPLDVLVQRLDGARDPRHTPLFQVVLNVLTSSAMVSLPGVTAGPMNPPRSLPTKFGLALNIQESDRRMRLMLEYNPDRYDTAMTRVLIGHLEALLRQAIADPGKGWLDYRLEPYADTVDATAVDVEPAAPPADRAEKVSTADRSAWRGAAWAVDRGLTSGDRITALSSHHGMLVAAVATAYAAGATLCIAPSFGTADVGAWLRASGVTVAFLSPPQLRALTGPLPALRYAFVENTGGLLPHDIQTLRDLAPGCRIVAVYRPGRDGRPLATYEVPQDWQLAVAPLRVPLGTELPGTPARLRHPDGQPAAVGEVVELCFGNQATADLGRRWIDGTLEYVAGQGSSPMNDPVHIVTALRELPDITDALVTEHADGAGEPALVAYVSGPGPDRHGAGIRQSLVTRLPDYLVPAQVVVLDILPRTRDGDYDLRALPEPGAGDGEDTYVAPRTPLERRLADIFEELLGLKRIGVYDSFFELNGFSLLATQLTSRVRDTFDVELPLREVFGAPTVEGMARLILWKQGERSDDLEALLAEIEAEEIEAEN